MDLNDLSVFVKVVEARSFTGAARHLKLPKTTVSRRIAQLEAALGVRLINRTTRALSLTDAGRRYYEDCAAALAAVEDANRRIGDVRAVPSGTLRVSAPVNAGSFDFARLIADFLALHPRVRIELVLTDVALNLVEERIDVALRSGQLADSSLVARKLRSNHRVLCASPAYLERKGAPRRPQDLSRHDCVIFAGSIDGATWTVDGPDGPEQVTVRGRVSVNTMLFALQSAVAGLGIVQLPIALAESEIAGGRLVTVLDGHTTGHGGFYVVYPTARHQSAAAKALIDFIVQWFAERSRRPAVAAPAGAEARSPPRSRRAAARVPARLS